MAHKHRKIHPVGPSEAAMRPGGPDDPRNYPRQEWGAPGLPSTPYEGLEDQDKARDKALVREGNRGETEDMKTLLSAGGDSDEQP